MTNTCALVIFAKTIGLSKVKTRLAATTNTKFAEDFYALSIKAVEAVANAIAAHYPITLYWALAEKEALEQEVWQGKNTLWTGDGGGLGKRLHSVYSRIQNKHKLVILIGTDSPQLSYEIIEKAIKYMENNINSCVIGPCIDGGFYLFAYKHKLPQRLWTDVKYSHKHTLQMLLIQLQKENINIMLLNILADCDTKKDLLLTQQALTHASCLLPEQDLLKKWLKNQSF